MQTVTSRWPIPEPTCFSPFTVVTRTLSFHKTGFSTPPMVNLPRISHSHEAIHLPVTKSSDLPRLATLKLNRDFARAWTTIATLERSLLPSILKTFGKPRTPNWHFMMACIQTNWIYEPCFKPPCEKTSRKQLVSKLSFSSAAQNATF